MDLNKVQLIWRVTQDVETKTTPNWNKVSNVLLATNRTWVDSAWIKQDLAEFHSLVFWWKLSDIVESYVKKWKKIYVEWRLETRSWKAKDWTKRYKTDIIWENIILLDSINSWNDKQVWKEVKNNKLTKTKKEEETTIEDIPF